MANGVSAVQALQSAPPIQIPVKLKKRNLGQQTRAAISTLINAGYGDELRAAIDEQIHILNTTPTPAEAEELKRQGKDPTKKPESPNDAYRRSVFR